MKFYGDENVLQIIHKLNSCQSYHTAEGETVGRKSSYSKERIRNDRRTMLQRQIYKSLEEEKGKKVKEIINNHIVKVDGSLRVQEQSGSKALGKIFI